MSALLKKRQWLAERPYFLALAIIIILFLWMMSGTMQAQEKPPIHHKQQAPIAKVQVKTMQAQLIHDAVELYGRTEPNRINTLRSEVQGKVIAVLAPRGSQVSKGQVIARIALNDLPAQIARANAVIKEREVEYQGVKALNKKGYQGKVQLAQAFAALEAAKAELTRLQLYQENTTIKAPFAGKLNERYIEEGDYLKAGDKVAMIVDLSPLVVRAYATEQQIKQLQVGQAASVRLLDHKIVSGKIRYLASVADQKTNTFKIEIALNNSDTSLVAGLSAEVDIALKAVSAIKLSPALLALDEQGNIGVKSVVDQHVVFTPINIVKTEADGIWLTGLGDSADIIVLGQGFVRAGDQVEAVKALQTKLSSQVTQSTKKKSTKQQGE